MKNATNIAAIAAVILAMAALIGLIIPVYSRLGQVEAEIRYLHEKMDAQHQEILEEFRRFSESLNSHSHTPDGDVISTVPTPTPTPTSTPAQPAAPR